MFIQVCGPIECLQVIHSDPLPNALRLSSRRLPTVRSSRSSSRTNVQMCDILSGEKWSEVCATHGGKAKLSQHSIQRRYREPTGCRDLDADGPAPAGEVDDHARFHTPRANALLVGPARQVVVSRHRPPAAKRDFEVGRLHSSIGSNGYAVITTSRLSAKSGSTITSHGRLRCRVLITQRPSMMSRRKLVALSSIRRKSSSVKRRSAIRLRRCGLSSSSQSHQGGHLRLVRTASRLDWPESVSA